VWPDVRNIIERTTLAVVPSAARLRAAHFFYLRSRTAEPEIRFVSRFVDPARDAVDVGANIGLYTLQLSKIARAVHAFEPNPMVRATLSAAELRNVKIYPVALSSRAGSSTFYIPLAEYGAIHGWGSLESGRCPSVDREYSVDVQTATLDSFELTDVSFIKIDVEGHEMGVLEGARATLSENRPTVLIEVDVTHRPTVDAALRKQAYRSQSMEQIFGQPGSPANLLYVPI
jgi:FkbM family methyltransferase